MLPFNKIRTRHQATHVAIYTVELGTRHQPHMLLFIELKTRHQAACVAMHIKENKASTIHVAIYIT